MEGLNKIFADFNNTDSKRRIRLITRGTLEDLERETIKLESGLKILLDDNDGLTALGIVQFSEDEKIWVAEINWDKLK